MDVVWLLVDSLSFSTTSFASDGPDTMPELKTLADEHAVTFTNAYVPGPLSPSSHASMFTGELPSAVGMHEAYPYFDQNITTITERMAETHNTSLFSANIWLFQGLERGFETKVNFSGPDLPYPLATNPEDYFDAGAVPELYTIWRFLRSDGKPIRSLLNYAAYRRQSDVDKAHRHVSRINDAIRKTRAETSGDDYVFANYMDIHPPLSASEEALERFASDIPEVELPIDVSPERHIKNAEKSYDVEAMERLYRAAIWDFDRALAPLVRDLVLDDVFVVVTSDHGIWNRNTAYEDSRLHVPLLVFAPDEKSRTITQTVNLRSLPRTIDQWVNDESEFNGVSLLDVESNQMSVTEIIHHSNDVYERTGRVDVTKSNHHDRELQRDIVLIQNGARVDYVSGEWTSSGKASTVSRLRERGEEILSQPVLMGDRELTYDDVVRERLEELGYI
ncbi:sulfatase-like hydrolase/transferase [Halopenitus sp. POP-27]|uniref:sulfatase-like hydrolase/transferase n=1 Tax=Halopenitus sp. POP-27 TaxID=2994425 RepID=UPI0024687C42|nr:sulfatase-like hydrolase/transferase [Halopenitus sp. POP-27]